MCVFVDSILSPLFAYVYTFSTVRNVDFELYCLSEQVISVGGKSAKLYWFLCHIVLFRYVYILWHIFVYVCTCTCIHYTTRNEWTFVIATVKSLTHRTKLTRELLSVHAIYSLSRIHTLIKYTKYIFIYLYLDMYIRSVCKTPKISVHSLSSEELENTLRVFVVKLQPSFVSSVNDLLIDFWTSMYVRVCYVLNIVHFSIYLFITNLGHVSTVEFVSKNFQI